MTVTSRTIGSTETDDTISVTTSHIVFIIFPLFLSLFLKQAIININTRGFLFLSISIVSI